MTRTDSQIKVTYKGFEPFYIGPFKNKMFQTSVRVDREEGPGLRKFALGDLTAVIRAAKQRLDGAVSGSVRLGEIAKTAPVDTDTADTRFVVEFINPIREALLSEGVGPSKVWITLPGDSEAWNSARLVTQVGVYPGIARLDPRLEIGGIRADVSDHLGDAALRLHLKVMEQEVQSADTWDSFFQTLVWTILIPDCFSGEGSGPTLAKHLVEALSNT